MGINAIWSQDHEGVNGPPEGAWQTLGEMGWRGDGENQVRRLG